MQIQRRRLAGGQEQRQQDGRKPVRCRARAGRRFEAASSLDAQAGGWLLTFTGG